MDRYTLIYESNNERHRIVAPDGSTVLRGRDPLAAAIILEQLNMELDTAIAIRTESQRLRKWIEEHVRLCHHDMIHSTCGDCIGGRARNE